MPHPSHDAITHNTRLTLEMLGPLADFELGFDRRSVQWVEDYVERLRGQPEFDPATATAARLVSVLGSYLGGCISASTGGQWAWQDQYEAWGIQLANGNVVFPFAKVDKLLRNGVAGGDSIAGFYDWVVDFVATGRLG